MTAVEPQSPMGGPPPSGDTLADALTPPQSLAVDLDMDAARYREQADLASRTLNLATLNYAAGQSDGRIAAARGIMAKLAPQWDAMATEVTLLRAARDDYRTRLEGALLAESAARADLAEQGDRLDRLEAECTERADSQDDLRQERDALSSELLAVRATLASRSRSLAEMTSMAIDTADRDEYQLVITEILDRIEDKEAAIGLTPADVADWRRRGNLDGGR